MTTIWMTRWDAAQERRSAEQKTRAARIKPRR
jgi:hypothetical protein